MVSDKTQILTALYRRTFSEDAIDFNDLLLDIVASVLGKSQLEAEAYVESNQTRRWNELLEQIDIDKRSGLQPLFHIPNREIRKMWWTPHVVTPNMTSKERRAKLRLSARPAMLSAIDDMSWREYEALGCLACILTGATKYKLTPHGREGGIDFFALVNLPANSHVFRGAHRPLRVVGQSKKYSTSLQSDKVKEFIQTLTELKENNPEVSKYVPSWFHTAQGPVVGWIISHNGVQAGGKSRAQSHGILISESKDIAEIASLSRTIDTSLKPMERAASFRGWVKALVADE